MIKVCGAVAKAILDGSRFSIPKMRQVDIGKEWLPACAAIRIGGTVEIMCATCLYERYFE